MAVKESNPVRDRKVRAVVAWLERREGVSTAISWYRGCASIAEYSEGNESVELVIVTENDVAKWWDRACLRMQEKGIGLDESLTEEWPNCRSVDESGDDPEPEAPSDDGPEMPETLPDFGPDEEPEF